MNLSGARVLATVTLAASGLVACAAEDTAEQDRFRAAYAELVKNATRPDADTQRAMADEREACVRGDDYACDRLWDMAIASDPSGSYLIVAGTCGGRQDTFIPEADDNRPNCAQRRRTGN